jgi:NTE family protein
VSGNENSSAPRLTHKQKALSPVYWLRGERSAKVEEGAIALCLSGGGYRAMLFHVGALWRLNEVGYLGKLSRVSSVSGGSITAGVLAMRWPELTWDANGVATNFEEVFVGRIRTVAGKTIDIPAGVLGLLTPLSINQCLAVAYDRLLFYGLTVAKALSTTGPTPAGQPPKPLFVINATDLRSGDIWRFSADPTLDSGTGSARAATLAEAVAASSAFPPILGPARRPGATLVDGGVYDNLGLEPAWTSCETVLISDAGGAFEVENGTLFHRHWGWRDWGTQSMRVLKAIDHQVRELRKHQAVAGFETHKDDPEHRKGAYWGIRSDIDDYPLADPLAFSPGYALELANEPTRLAKVKDDVQMGLINWGYAICDTALRSHVVKGAPAPDPVLPYPEPPRSTGRKALT